MTNRKNVIILISTLGLSYIIIFLLSPIDDTEYTMADTEYWRETGNNILIKTKYDYNDKDNVALFPKIIGEWKGSDYKYPDFVYKKLNADILVSRAYKKGNQSVIWMDIINSKTGESFHKQRICVTGAGWNIDNESIAEFDIAKYQDTGTTLKSNRLDISKGNKRQIMVYWFLFKKFGSNNSVTMIRLSTPVRKNNTDATFNYMKSFVEDQLFGTLYESTKGKDITTAEYLMTNFKKQ